MSFNEALKVFCSADAWATDRAAAFAVIIDAFFDYILGIMGITPKE